LSLLQLLPHFEELRWELSARKSMALSFCHKFEGFHHLYAEENQVSLSALPSSRVVAATAGLEGPIPAPVTAATVIKYVL